MTKGTEEEGDMAAWIPLSISLHFPFFSWASLVLFSLCPTLCLLCCLLLNMDSVGHQFSFGVHDTFRAEA